MSSRDPTSATGCFLCDFPPPPYTAEEAVAGWLIGFAWGVSAAKRGRALRLCPRHTQEQDEVLAEHGIHFQGRGQVPQ